MGHSEERGEREEVDPLELMRRVLFSMMSPVAKLSSTQSVGLKELTKMMRLSYFRRLRHRGSTLREIGEALDVSVRTAKRLSKQLKENFFAPELEHELLRRIEFMLWAAPMSKARLHQVIEDAGEDDIAEALAQLQREERIHELDDRPGFYEATRPGAGTRLVRQGLVARIGALNAFMDNVTNAIYGRFFVDEEAAFARTLSFRLRPQELDELRALYEEVIWPRLRELDALAEQDPGDDEAPARAEPLALQLSMCWAPYELIERRQEEDG